MPPLLLHITNDRDDWPPGEYSVSMWVKDDSGTLSLPVTVTFEIIIDVTAPTVPTASINPVANTLSFTASDYAAAEPYRTNYGVSGYELVFDGLTTAELIAIYGASAVSGTTVTFEATPAQTAQSLVNGSPATFADVPLPPGDNYTVQLVVYDAAGNNTTVNLPTLDYSQPTAGNEEIKGLLPSQPGITVAKSPTAGPSGVVGVNPSAPGTLPASYNTVTYTTANTTYSDGVSTAG